MQKYLFGIFCFLCFFQCLHAQNAQESFVKAKEFLQQSNFVEALKCYEKACKLDKYNQEYKKEYMILRQVIKIRKYMPEVSDSEKWLSMAYSLYSYYMQNKAYDEMVAIAKEIHEKNQCSDSLLVLAESYIINHQNKDAIKLISQITPPPPFLQLLYAIAVVREGEAAEGKKLYWELEKKELKNSFYFFYKASLEVLIGYKETAIKTLVICFKNTPPQQLTLLKKRALESKDFANIFTEPNFQEAMKTQSIIPESSCSEGKDCSTCPKRGKCGVE